MNNLKKNYACYLIIIIGIYLRIYYYLQNRSLWIDECFFAFSIFDNDLLNNLQLQKFNQFSPLGFLFIQKFVISLFGHSEYALRFFPLICGIISIFLFYKLLKRFYSGIALIIPLSLFSFSSQLIYYSSEAKQYSSDVLTTIILIFLGLKLQGNNINGKLKKIILISAPFYIFFSSTSIFILFSITACFLTKYFFLKKKELVKENIIFSVGWASSLIFYLVYNYDTQIRNANLHKFWHYGFVSEKISALKILEDAFSYLGFRDFSFDLTIFTIGVISILIRRRILGLYLITPIVLVTICSFLKLYPAAQRLILFTTPMVFILIGECVDFITYSKKLPIKAWGTALVWIFLILQLDTNLGELNKSMKKEDIKYCLKYINDHKKPNDVIYLQYFSQYCFKYYAKDFGFNDEFPLISNWSHPTIGKDFYKYQRWYTKPNYNKIFISKASKYTTLNRRKIDYELKMLKGNSRVWILFSHDALAYSEKFKSHLERFGKKLNFIEVPAREHAVSHLYLYDFSKKNKPSENKKTESRFKDFIHRIFKSENK